MVGRLKALTCLEHGSALPEELRRVCFPRRWERQVRSGLCARFFSTHPMGGGKAEGDRRWMLQGSALVAPGPLQRAKEGRRGCSVCDRTWRPRFGSGRAIRTMPPGRKTIRKKYTRRPCIRRWVGGDGLEGQREESQLLPPKKGGGSSASGRRVSGPHLQPSGSQDRGFSAIAPAKPNSYRCGCPSRLLHEAPRLVGSVERRRRQWLRRVPKSGSRH